MKIANRIKIFIVTLVLLICFDKNYAMSQKEAGEVIAQFAINFFDNYASETVYSVKGWADNQNGQRAFAYRGQKTSGEAEPSDGMKSRGMKSINYTDKYSMDCVGFVSFCIHHSLKLGNANTFTCFVTPQSGGSNGFTKVTDGTRMPGDILATSGHVAVYIGNGEIIDSAAAGPNRSISRRKTANNYPSTYRITQQTAAGIEKSNTTVQFQGKGSATYSFGSAGGGTTGDYSTAILSGTPPEHMTTGCSDYSGYFSWTNVSYLPGTSSGTSSPAGDGGSSTTVTIPANIEADQWIYPLTSRHTADPSTGARYFGAPRDGGARAHAGMDLIVAPGVEVIAMTDGTVIQAYNFYQNTDAVEVKNDDGSIARYTEIAVYVSAGQKVKKGDKLGKVIANRAGTSMLHIEVYDGSGSGQLTQSNSTYKNVPSKNYRRRSDILDPMFIKDLPMATVE